VAARWNYNQGTPGARPVDPDGPPGGAQPWLRRAVALNPALEAFVAAGLYDSLNSCAANAELVARLEPPLAGSITAKCYGGGHAMYEDPEIRRQVTADVAAFLRDRVSALRRSP
jgi:hypothetical protein